MNTYDEGGLHILDFSTLSYTIKINWLKQFRKNPVSLWNFIPNDVFSQFGGLDFLLLCNYNIDNRLYYLLFISRFSWLGR